MESVGRAVVAPCSPSSTMECSPSPLSPSPPGAIDNTGDDDDGDGGEGVGEGMRGVWCSSDCVCFPWGEAGRVGVMGGGRILSPLPLTLPPPTPYPSPPPHHQLLSPKGNCAVIIALLFFALIALQLMVMCVCNNTIYDDHQQHRDHHHHHRVFRVVCSFVAISVAPHLLKPRKWAVIGQFRPEWRCSPLNCILDQIHWGKNFPRGHKPKIHRVQHKFRAISSP